MTRELWSLTAVIAIAAIVPLVLGLLRWRVAAVVLLLVGGAAFGPSGLRIISVSEPIELLSNLGLGLLFFLAGMEIDATAMRGRGGRLAAYGWIISIVLAAAVAFALARAGMLQDGLGFAIALTSTALGTLLPSLHDSGDLERPFGRYFLAAGAWGEFGPVLAIAILLGSHAAWASILIVLGFLVLAMVIWLIGRRFATPRVRAILDFGNHTSSQTGLRFTLLVVILLLALASGAGLDLVLGAFVAGIIVRRLIGDVTSSPLPEKIEAVAYGFFIPVFFVVAGANLDLAAIAQSLGVVVIIFVALYVIRGLPTWFLYRRALPNVGERTRFSLYVATGLPIIIALVTVEIADGVMTERSGSALIGAGALTVLVFPLVGDIIARRQRRTSGSTGSDQDRAAKTA